MRPLARPLAAFVLLASTRIAAAGPSITLNGVSIDGVTGQKFENCTVVIDEKGDVHIQAKGYAVTSDDGRQRAAYQGSAGAAGAWNARSPSAFSRKIRRRSSPERKSAWSQTYPSAWRYVQ